MTLRTSNVRSYMLMEVGNAVQAWYQLRNLPPPAQQQQAGTADDFNGGGSGGSASSALQYFWIDYWLQCIPLPGSTEVWRWGGPDRSPHNTYGSPRFNLGPPILK